MATVDKLTMQRAKSVIANFTSEQKQLFEKRFNDASDEQKAIAIKRVAQQGIQQQPGVTAPFGTLQGAERKGEFIEKARPAETGRFFGEAAKGQLTGGLIGGLLGAATGPAAPIAIPTFGAAGGVLGRIPGAVGTQLAQQRRREGITPETGVDSVIESIPIVGTISRFAKLSPERKIKVAEEIGITGIVELASAGIAIGGRKIGQALFRDFIPGIGGVSKTTRDIAKQPGMLDRIKDPAKRDVRFIQDNIVPRIQKGVNSILGRVTKKTTRFLRTLGISEDSAKTFTRSGKKKIDNVVIKYGGSHETMSTGIKEFAVDNLDNVGVKFDNVFNKLPDDLIDIRPAFKDLEKELLDNGLVDRFGQRIGGKSGVRTLDTLTDIYQELRFSTDASKTGKGIFVSKPQWSRLKLRVQNAKSGVPEVDRFMFDPSSNLLSISAILSLISLVHLFLPLSLVAENLVPLVLSINVFALEYSF